jgi:glutaredoxin 3
MACKCRINIGEVRLYSTPTSAQGREASTFLDRKGIVFEDLDVTANEQARQEMIRLSGQEAVPVITIGDKTFVGFDPVQLGEFLF